MSKNDKKDVVLEKCEELINRLNELKKAIEPAVNIKSNRQPSPGLARGWSHDANTGVLHHSVHGVISPGKQDDGTFHPMHNGKKLGIFSNAVDAGRAMGEHARSLRSYDTNMFNRRSPNMPSPTKMGKLNMVKQEVNKSRQYTPAQLAAIEEARSLKKTSEETPWVRHSSIPNGDEEVMKAQKVNSPQVAENIMANQLANMMAGKAMLGIKPPAQPTDEEMFGHLVPSEEEIQKAENQWNNKMNWLEEACKPIASRFNSPEEEQRYWDSIKVVDRDDNKPGY